MLGERTLKASIHGMIQKSSTTDTMHPTPDANGTISWSEAVQFVFSPDPELNFLSQFAQDYSHLCGERIDLGELQTWYSELVIAAIADMVFS